MAKIIQQLLKQKRNEQQNAAQLQCNFQNNYYGDQVCVARHPAR